MPIVVLPCVSSAAKANGISAKDIEALRRVQKLAAGASHVVAEVWTVDVHVVVVLVLLGPTLDAPELVVGIRHGDSLDARLSSHRLALARGLGKDRGGAEPNARTGGLDPDGGHLFRPAEDRDDLGLLFVSVVVVWLVLLVEAQRCGALGGLRGVVLDGRISCVGARGVRAKDAVTHLGGQAAGTEWLSLFLLVEGRELFRYPVQVGLGYVGGCFVFTVHKRVVIGVVLDKGILVAALLR